MVLTQELKKSKYSIHKAPRLSIMRMLHCKLKNMFIRPSYKDVRIRYMILLPIVMYLAQVIQVSVTLLWLLRKHHPWRRWVLWVSLLYPKNTILWFQRRFFTSKNQWFRSQNPNYKFILKDLDTQIASIHLIDLKKKVM